MDGGRPKNVEAGKESRYKYKSNSPVKSGFRRVDDDVMTMWSKGPIQNELNNRYVTQQRSRETQQKLTQISLLPRLERKHGQKRNERLSRGHRKYIEPREGKITANRNQLRIEKRDESERREARDQVRMYRQSDRKRQLRQGRDELDDRSECRSDVGGADDLNLIEEIFDGIWDAVDVLVGDVS